MVDFHFTSFTLTSNVSRSFIVFLYVLISFSINLIWLSLIFHFVSLHRDRLTEEVVTSSISWGGDDRNRWQVSTREHHIHFYTNTMHWNTIWCENLIYLFIHSFNLLKRKILLILTHRMVHSLLAGHNMWRTWGCARSV